MTLRIGFIGCGKHATASLYPAVSALGWELVATCARTMATAQTAARRFGAGQAYDDPAAMLAGEPLDAVLLCVPVAEYAGLLRLCLDAGVPAFTEKPGGASAAEVHDLAQRSEDLGVSVMVGYMKRFAPAYARARACILDPAFGLPTLGSFTFVMGGWAPDMRGYVIDNTVHVLDLARSLLGELEDVHTLRGPSAEGRHALVVSATAAAGAVVTFQLGSTGSWFHRNESVEVFGSGSSVYVDNLDTCVLRAPDRPEQVWRPNYTVPLPANMSATVMGFVPELEHFDAVVRQGGPCESDLRSAARTLELAEVVIGQLGL